MDSDLVQLCLKTSDCENVSDACKSYDINYYGESHGYCISDFAWAWMFTYKTEHSELCELFTSQRIHLARDFEIIVMQRNKQCDFCGYYAIHSAVIRGDLDIMDTMLLSQTKVNVFNENGETPLHVACNNQDLKMIQRLVSYGADVNAQDDVGMAPLHICVVQCNVEAAEYLLHHGAKVDLLLSERLRITPLHWAIENDFGPIVDALIKAGADVNFKDSRDYTSIYKAVAQNNIIGLAHLTNNKVNVNGKYRKGQTLLQLACKNGYDACARLLLEAGASANSKDEYKMNALHFAAKTNKRSLVQQLVMYGCDINARDRWSRSPLDIAVLQNEPAMVISLLNYGASTDRIGRTLHKATSYRFKDIIRILFNRGVDVDIADKFGKTPLMLAVEHGDLDMAEFLLSHGADPNARGKSSRPMIIEAIHQGNSDLVQALLDRGADECMVDSTGWTPLFHAHKVNDKKIIRILFEVGSKNSCTEENYTR